jgi:hypothetical protein
LSFSAFVGKNGNAELVHTKLFVSGKNGLFDIACNVDVHDAELVENPTWLRIRSGGRLFHPEVVTNVNEKMSDLIYLMCNCG